MERYAALSVSSTISVDRNLPGHGHIVGIRGSEKIKFYALSVDFKIFEPLRLLTVGSGFHELKHFIQRNQSLFNKARIQKNFITRGIKYL